AALLGFLAYRTKSNSLAFAAALIGGTWAAGVLSLGFILFPILFVAWWKQRGKGFGWLLLGTMVASPVVLYLRIPWPEPFPPGPTHEVEGIVRQVQTVREIWTTDEGGQDIRQPF